MPTPTKGPRVGNGPAHEKKLLSGLAKSLIEHGAITTTEAKARRLQPLMDKLITRAKKGDLHSRRILAKKIGPDYNAKHDGFNAVYHLMYVVAPQIDPEREGGYTRIVKLPSRKGDNAPMAQISIVTEKVEKKAVVKAAADAAKTAAKADETKKVEDAAEAAAAEEAEDATVEAKVEEAEDAAETAETDGESEAEKTGDEDKSE